MPVRCLGFAARSAASGSPQAVSRWSAAIRGGPALRGIVVTRSSAALVCNATRGASALALAKRQLSSVMASTHRPHDNFPQPSLRSSLCKPPGDSCQDCSGRLVALINRRRDRPPAWEEPQEPGRSARSSTLVRKVAMQLTQATTLRGRAQAFAKQAINAAGAITAPEAATPAATDFGFRSEVQAAHPGRWSWRHFQASSSTEWRPGRSGRRAVPPGHPVSGGRTAVRRAIPPTARAAGR